MTKCIHMKFLHMPAYELHKRQPKQLVFICIPSLPQLLPLILIFICIVNFTNQYKMVRIECKASSLVLDACMTHSFTDHLAAASSYLLPLRSHCIFFGPKQTDCIFSEGIGLQVREIIRFLLLLFSSGW
jgi:hypothetical protein